MFRRPATFKDIRVAEMNSEGRLNSLLFESQEIPFIPFSQIQEKLNSGFRYTLEPDLAKWTSSGNHIISLKNFGQIFLAEVQYNQQSNQIFPPK